MDIYMLSIMKKNIEYTGEKSFWLTSLQRTGHALTGHDVREKIIIHDMDLRYHNNQNFT
jgi:hypothetical protein